MKLFSNLKNQATSFLDRYKQQSPATYAAAEQAVGAILITDGFIGIENPFGGKKRPGIFGTVGGVILGIVFMMIPTFIGNITNANKMTATTSATVVSVSQPVTTTNSEGRSSGSTCAMTARYTVDGKEFTKRSSMSSSNICSLSEGQTIKINYDPNNPNSWGYDLNSLNLFSQIFFWAGLAAVISSVITFIIRLLSIIFGWKLLQDGRKNAANLPAGTDLQAIKNEVRQSFLATIFNFGGGNIINQAQTAIAPQVTTVQPVAQPAPPAPQAPIAPTPAQPQTLNNNNIDPTNPTQPA